MIVLILLYFNSREKMTMKMKWKSIETTPKDGSLILLYPSGCWDETAWPCDAEVGYWDDDEKQWSSKLHGCEYYTGPTHWASLPKPPKALHKDLIKENNELKKKLDRVESDLNMFKEELERIHRGDAYLVSCDVLEKLDKEEL